MMRWKHVFDASRNFPRYRDIYEAASACQAAGYKFMSYNGNIYFLEYREGRDPICHDTLIKTEELE